MRIAADLLSIRPDGSAGGATGFSIELLKGIAAQDQTDLIVLCAEWNYDYLKKQFPHKIELLQMMGEKRIIGIKKIDHILNRFFYRVDRHHVLQEKNIDILYCPFSAPTFKTKGIPTVSTILDIQHEYYPHFFEPSELEHRRKFYGDIVKKVEHVACISDYTRDTFCEKYGYPKERAETIYIAVQNRFSDKDSTILDRLGLEAQKYVIFPANFWEHKNHKLLINSYGIYACLHKENALKLVLTGNPLEKSDYFHKMIQTMGLDNRIVITGYLTNAELYGILDGAKGLIYPSLFEGFGIPVVEAMYLNKLIACSNLTSLPEIGCDAIHYFNPKKPDEIVEAFEYLHNSVMKEEISSEYKKRLEIYQTDKMVKAYIALFKKTIANKDDLLFEEGVNGIWPDGWSGGEVEVYLAQRKGMMLTLKAQNPEFTSINQELSFIQNGVEKKYTINKGETIDIEEPITEDHTEIILRIQKTWSPKEVLKSEDDRQLGIMIDKLLLAGEQEIDLKGMV